MRIRIQGLQKCGSNADSDPKPWFLTSTLLLASLLLLAFPAVYGLAHLDNFQTDVLILQSAHLEIDNFVKQAHLLFKYMYSTQDSIHVGTLSITSISFLNNKPKSKYCGYLQHHGI